MAAGISSRRSGWLATWVVVPARRLRLVFSAERVPYLLPALLAFAAWGLTHISDRLVKAPTLEYRCKAAACPDDAGATDWSCRVLNLSEDRVFREMTLILRTPEQTGCTVKRVEEVEWLGTAHHAQGRPAQIDGQTAIFLRRRSTQGRRSG